ncbi:MAG TPA: hypothetical protein VF714_11280, partial [Jatrophihabitans sp.]
EVYAQMRRSYDEGIAEFLDLEFVKPNTLGNSRMLLTLDGRPGPSSGPTAPSRRCLPNHHVEVDTPARLSSHSG